MHDALIIGASVAGSATAIHLARRGRSVLLIDRASFPRRKACGEGLFPLGVAELADLVDLDELLPRCATLSSLRFRLADASAEAVIGHQGQRGLGLQRSVLDAALLQAAIDAGADVRTESEVRHLVLHSDSFMAEAGGELLMARVIVAADGARSSLRRQAGLDGRGGNRRYGISAHLRVFDANPGRIDVRFCDGYEVYLTPVADGLVNAALLLNRATMPAVAGDLTAGYASLLSASGAVDGEFAIEDEPLATGPFPATSSAVWRHNFVLAGDATGFHDPITGEGMSLALRGARYCADAIDAYIADGSPRHIREYGNRVRRLARNSRLFARLILSLSARPKLGRRVLDNLSRRPETFSRLVAVNGGELPLAALRPRDLVALLIGS